MASAAAEPSSPVLANIVVVAGFVVIFTTFATGSAWSWIIGGLMVVAGALWAGAVDGTSADEAPTAGPQPTEPTGGRDHEHVH